MGAGAGKQLEWTEAARSELAEGITYIAEDNPAAALGVWERIEYVARLLLERPGIGRVGALPGTRELPIARTFYTLIYRTTSAGIQILHVMHQRRSGPA